MGSDWSAVGARGTDDPAALVDARLEAMLAAATGPVDWRALESAQARECWSALREWVGRFRDEFGFDHRVVPPCWYLHPALVGLLSALRDHWVCAYDPLNTPVGASEWHRALMQLEPRLREWASRTGCSVGGHRPDVVAAYPDDSDQWERHVAVDVAARAEREMRATLTVTRQVFETTSVDDGGARG